MDLRMSLCEQRKLMEIKGILKDKKKSYMQVTEESFKNSEQFASLM